MISQSSRYPAIVVLVIVGIALITASRTEMSSSAPSSSVAAASAKLAEIRTTVPATSPAPSASASKLSEKNDNNKLPPPPRIRDMIPFPDRMPRPKWCKSPHNASSFRRTNFSFNPFNCSLWTRKKIPEFTRRDRNVTPRFAVITLTGPDPKRGYDAPLQTLRRTSFSNKLAYCQKHGYDLIVEDKSVGRLKHHNRALWFAKLLAVRKWLPHYEAVLWVDHDALFVDLSARIEDLVDKIQRLEQMLLKGRDEAGELDKLRVRKQYRYKNHLDEINLGADVTTSGSSNNATGGGGEQQQFENQQQHQQQQPIIMKKKIDLLIWADPMGLNTGVWLMKNTSWSLDFLDRIYDRIPAAALSAFTLADNDSMYYMLNVHFRGVMKRLKGGRLIDFPWNNDTRQVAVDRHHVFVMEDTAWNKEWGYMISALNTDVPHVWSDWGFTFPGQEKLPRPSVHRYLRHGQVRRRWFSRNPARVAPDSRPVIVHFIACRQATGQCISWLSFLHEKVLSEAGLSDVTIDQVPGTYFPPSVE